MTALEHIERRLASNMTPEEKMLIVENNMSIIQNRVIEQDSILEKHHKLLVEGNGDLPVLERLRNLETYVAHQKFWLRTVAVAIVLQTITFGVAALVYFIRLIPLLEKLSVP